MSDRWMRSHAWREYRDGRMVPVERGRCMMWARHCLKVAAMCREQGILGLADHFIREARQWRFLATNPVMYTGFKGRIR